MKIDLEMPADDYLLLKVSDLGRLVSMLREKGVYDEFREMDIQVRLIKYIDPRIEKRIRRLTKPRRGALRRMANGNPDIVYRGKKRVVGFPGLSRKTLDALVKDELAVTKPWVQETGPIKTTDRDAIAYVITDLGREVESQITEE